ncbi:MULTISPECIES: hydrogen peroxide-inducible genes activator [Kordiimonas]|jgi:LysR family hydrogen peroxide-inducible transcriptional activator|uniref:LysR family transcriptional regulator, hydrogen peroxide-inducible genes activator n=1 Tax=Kordiimonas lacus TaxID=637679 RepID=A0A1G6Y5F4_9PROT|nr:MULTISPECIES: hydrogen peroxide-inducible genes activator [Kordiimonas]SDD85531.1 LysR family transcriptional regulator, hydrogen peroxide-inducible genes activator [Kordiimonas lacus]
MSFPPTLKQLRYLVALHRTNHFGKAADACHVTQSTLSAGLQELENLLGTQLVERTKRSVMFTALGEEIVRRAQGILNDVDDLTDLATSAKDPLKGIVRMGVIPTIAPFLLPKIMPAISRKLPDLELHLREDKSAELCELVRSGELDLVLYALPYACGDVAELPLFHDPFLVAFPEGEAPKGGIKSTELDEKRLMLLEEGHCLRDHALEACQLLGRGARREMAGTSLNTILQMVAAGHGITLLPGMAVEAGLTEGTGVEVLPFADIVPTRTIGLIWRKTNPRASTFEALGRVIKEVGADHHLS